MTEFVDSFEETLSYAHELMRRGDGEKAVQFLDRAKNLSISNGDSEEAGLFASTVGSYLVAMGRDREGLDAYLEAEKIGGSEASYKLTTAKHLLDGLRLPQRALDKLGEILEAELASSSMKQACRELRDRCRQILDDRQSSTT